jgi:hypothetical protein
MKDLDRIFEQILKESDKEDATSNEHFEDTPQAWFEIDTTGPETYAVIRKADGSSFKSNSYAKIVSTTLLTPTNKSSIALLNNTPVYVQNIGDKDYCETVQKRVQDILNYRNIGEDW